MDRNAWKCPGATCWAVLSHQTRSKVPQSKLVTSECLWVKGTKTACLDCKGIHFFLTSTKMMLISYIYEFWGEVSPIHPNPEPPCGVTSTKCIMRIRRQISARSYMIQETVDCTTRWEQYKCREECRYQQTLWNHFLGRMINTWSILTLSSKNRWLAKKLQPTWSEPP